MATLTIDGRECSFEGKKTILQVALENDIEIPHYCYHPGMSIVASCRICLAEVAQPNPRNDNKVELIPKLIPTCQTLAVDGMEIYLTSPKSLANQKAVMEYLLINHPLDCPVCDQAGECSLQDYSHKYGRGCSRFEETKIKQPKKDLGPNVLLYSDRCIMCSRCVRFTRQVTGTNEIGVFGRGSAEQIDIFPGKALDNELSGNVVDVCPVGAMIDKDFLMSMRVWNLKRTASIDGLTASGDNISIEHNEGKIYRVKPRTNMDVNQWWTSDEIRYGWKFVHSEDRLRGTAIRQELAQKNAQTPRSWNAAYDAAALNFKQIIEQHGAGSLALMVSPMLSCEEAYLLGKFIIALDGEATIAIGPIPTRGQDKTFPGGYTIYAEKCPNARGVKRALGQLTHSVLDYEQLLAKLADADGCCKGLLLTGNYPDDWADESLGMVVDRLHFTVLIDTLASSLSGKVDILLAGATWAEKAGTFENVKNRLQSFAQAIEVLESAKSEGQIALDMMAATGQGARVMFDPSMVRRELGDAFVSEVHQPQATCPNKASDLEYVRL